MHYWQAATTNSSVDGNECFPDEEQIGKAHIDEANEAIGLIAQLREAKAEEEREGNDAQDVHVDGRGHHIVRHRAPRHHQQRLKGRALPRRHTLRCRLRLPAQPSGPSLSKILQYNFCRIEPFYARYAFSCLVLASSAWRWRPVSGSSGSCSLQHACSARASYVARCSVQLCASQLTRGPCIARANSSPKALRKDLVIPASSMMEGA